MGDEQRIIGVDGKDRVEVVLVSGILHPEHWDAIYHLKLSSYLYPAKVNNRVGTPIRKKEMVTGYTSFYNERPRMCGDFLGGRGDLQTRWRWNQSSGQVAVKMVLNLEGRPKQYYVRIVKYNNRVITPKDVCFTLSRRWSRTFKAWVMEIFELLDIVAPQINIEYKCSFYWCVSGSDLERYLDRDVVTQDGTRIAYTYDQVCKIIDSVPLDVLDVFLNKDED